MDSSDDEDRKEPYNRHPLKPQVFLKPTETLKNTLYPTTLLYYKESDYKEKLYLSSKTIYENDWERHPQRVLISLLFPIWHTAIVSVIHYHGVHTLSMLLSSTSLVSLCRCPTPYRVSANLQAGLSCTTKIVTLHGKVYRMANWPSTIQVI